MVLFTYHLSNVSNLHLILGNLLLLIRFDVGPCHRGLEHQVLGLGSQVLINITARCYSVHSSIPNTSHYSGCLIMLCKSVSLITPYCTYIENIRADKGWFAYCYLSLFAIVSSELLLKTASLFSDNRYRDALMQHCHRAACLSVKSSFALYQTFTSCCHCH